MIQIKKLKNGFNKSKRSSWSTEGAEEVHRTDDGDTLVTNERQEMAVAGDDQVSPAFDGAGHDMVVVGVVRYGVGDFLWLDEDGLSGKKLEEVFRVPVVPSEATEDFAKLVRYGRGKNQGEAPIFKRLPNTREKTRRKPVCRKKDIRVKDGSQPAAVFVVLHE